MFSGSSAAAEQPTTIEKLPISLHNIIIDYLDESSGHQGRYQCVNATLLLNLQMMYAREITHNLLWHINIAENLEKAQKNQACLRQMVKVRCPHDQLVEGTALQVMLAAGDRDTKKIKEGEQHSGIVEELLEKCFAGMYNEAEKQIDAWSLDEKASEETMKPYYEAMEKFYQHVMRDIKEVPKDDKPYEELLVSLAEKLKAEFKARPDHVVKSGLLFNMRIFIKFFTLWKKMADTLEGIDNGESNLFASVMCHVLQTQVPRCDLEMLKKGMGDIEKGAIADHINFSKGVPEEVDLRSSSIFSFFGVKYSPSPNRTLRLQLSGSNRGVGMFFDFFNNLVRTKESKPVVLRKTPS